MAAAGASTRRGQHDAYGLDLPSGEPSERAPPAIVELDTGDRQLLLDICQDRPRRVALRMIGPAHGSRHHVHMTTTCIQCRETA